ncbi:MAG: hypothetical protein A2106_06555 [Planctomycetes bacterium GWF2_40_8]|nr:MAG: hypothetical protein A2106_06555 [Planctomycetes bacterium GWF2_40_8]OHC03792.1 MAG: hypothetical protein A3H23_00635 [Planctomycetes bacterium RIFCSPLOWO2_12_FULL_40_19]
MRGFNVLSIPVIFSKILSDIAFISLVEKNYIQVVNVVNVKLTCQTEGIFPNTIDNATKVFK